MHAHAEAVLPFTVSTTPLVPVVHMASFIGAHLPVWDIRDNFGDTNLLVVNMTQGRDLARTLGGERVVLMRGHGFTAAARSLQEAIRMSVYMPLNARVLSEARRLGEVEAPVAGRDRGARVDEARRPVDVARLGVLGRARGLRRPAQRAGVTRPAAGSYIRRALSYRIFRRVSMLRSSRVAISCRFSGKSWSQCGTSVA